MRNVFFTLMMIVSAATAQAFADYSDFPSAEEEYLGFEVIFINTIPEPNKVYQVVFSTVDQSSGQCQVDIEELPNETAEQYDGIVDFMTEIHSIIFKPNSEKPEDVVWFEYTYDCPEFDDMGIPMAQE